MNPVLDSARWISENSKHVKIGSKIDDAAREFLILREQGKFRPFSWKEETLNPKVANDDALKWIFVVDLLNFSFWSDSPTEICAIKYNENLYTGYWSLCAAINRAISEGIPITDPNYMKNITLEQVSHIFRSENEISIPLLPERQKVLNEAGNVIIEKFGGEISNIVKNANQSALELVQILVNNFTSFKDQGIFLEKTVYFHKRAQIFVADVWACFEGQSYGNFPDIDTITMFADYRVPQGLLYVGALEYSEHLINVLNNNELKLGDEYESEIRGNSIWSVELILKSMKKQEELQGTQISEPLNAIAIDFFLWTYAKQKSSDTHMKSLPIHKIRTIFY